MRKVDRPEFVKVLVGLATLKPGAQLPSTESIDIWFAAMADWSIEDFKSAATHLAKSVEFMPSPFHFEQLRRAGEMTANEAWAVALQASKNWRNAVAFPSDRIGRAAQCVGGLREIAFTDQAELHWLRKRFMDAFDELVDVDRVRGELPQIARVEASRIALKGPIQVSNVLPLPLLQKPDDK